MKEYYLKQGFRDYLSKPISPRALDEVIGNALDSTALSCVHEQGSFAVALEGQRVDMLNHYRESFTLVPEAEWEEKFDAGYFERFIALIESFNAADAVLSEQAALLAEAGRRGDVLKIRANLPAFYEALKKQKHQGNAESKEPLSERVREILAKLKKAIQDGETTSAEALLHELGTISLSADSRALYFLLYHFMLTGETEKALGAIMLREKMEQS
jgi:CheY-like chemotaxis protein